MVCTTGHRKPAREISPEVTNLLLSPFEATWQAKKEDRASLYLYGIRNRL